MLAEHANGGVAMNIAVESDRRFDSVSELLSYAFGQQARKVHPAGLFQKSARGTNPGELGPYDRIAEGMMYYHAAMQALRGRVGLFLAVKAFYTVPTDADLIALKDEAVFRLARLLRSSRKSIPDPWFAYDVIDGWAHHKGGPRSHTYEWWAHKMDRPYKRVQEWATRNDTKRRGLVPAAERYLRDAETVIEDELTYRNIL